jgi:hypothetical protein
VSGRPLNEAQYRRLRLLAAGAFVVTPRKREWEPLVRRGLVRIVGLETNTTGYWAPFIGITADGYRALGDLAERYGLAELPQRREVTA